MAPKRSAASADAQASKRCKVVVDAVKASSSLPDSVISMLSSVVPGALGPLPDERDAYQQAFIEMVGTALASEEAALKSQVAEAETEVGKASKAVEESEAETRRLQDAIAAKAEEITAKTARSEEDEASVSTCEESLKTAQKSQEAFATEAGKVKDEREQVAKVMSEDFNFLRDSPPVLKRESKRHINSITKSLEHHEAEEALVLATPCSLGKGLDSRGTFDKKLIDHLGQFLTETLEKFDAKISANEQETARLAAAVDAAQQALEAANTQETASSEALKTAEAEHKGLKAELKEAEKKGKEVSKESAQARKGEAEAASTLEEFADVLNAFACQRDGPPQEPAPAEP